MNKLPEWVEIGEATALGIQWTGKKAKLISVHPAYSKDDEPRAIVMLTGDDLIFEIVPLTLIRGLEEELA